MSSGDLVIFISLVSFFSFAVFPFAGAIFNRMSWRSFRRRFDELRLAPYIDYASYRNESEENYRFLGIIDSISESKDVLWIKNETLTIPIALQKSKIYFFPQNSGDEQESKNTDSGNEIYSGLPEKLKIKEVGSINQNAKVFVGGQIGRADRSQNNAEKRPPLLIVFFEGEVSTLTQRIISAGRHKNEYWNTITPFSITLGIFSLLFTASHFSARPSLSKVIVFAFIAVFLPLFPLIPPGLLFTLFYQRFWKLARKFVTYKDITLLPLKLINNVQDNDYSADNIKGVLNKSCLPVYGYKICAKSLLDDKVDIPFITPILRKVNNDKIYLVGNINIGEDGVLNDELPVKPDDPLLVYGAYPGNPTTIAKHYAHKAYFYEALAWLFLFAGIAINIFFSVIIVNLLL